MKKKREAKLSSTQTSTANGPPEPPEASLRASRRKPQRYKEQLRKTHMLARIVTLEDKVSGLLRSLIDGSLPESLTVKNLIKSQQGLLGELDGIKRFVANGIREQEKQKQDAALTVLRIEQSLWNLNATMGGAEDKLAEIRTLLTLEEQRKKHGNKAKQRLASGGKTARPH